MYFSRDRAAMLAASTAAFGLSALIRKIAVDRMTPLQFQVVAACVYLVFLPFYVWLATKDGTPLVDIDRKGIIWAVIATAIASFGGIMFGYALKSGNDAGVVTSLSSLSPIITMFLSFAILGERPSASSACGCALVLAGVALISFRG